MVIAVKKSRSVKILLDARQLKKCCKGQISNVESGQAHEQR